MTLFVTLHPVHAKPVADTHSQPAATTPGKRPRLEGVDAARGVALLGMIAVHSLYQSTASGRSTWSFTLFGGQAAAAFAVLAGVGIAFMTGRRRTPLSAGQATVAMLTVRCSSARSDWHWDTPTPRWAR